MPFNPMNIFKASTTQEKDTRIISSAKTIKELEELAALGKEMLNDARYQRYKENFEKLLGVLIKDLINYRHADNNIYAVNIRTTIQQIKDLLSLIDTPITFLNHVKLQELELSSREEGKGGPYARD